MKIKKQDYLYFFLASFLLFGIWAVDSLIDPEIMLTSIYAVPILITAYRFNYKIITLFSIATIIIYSLQANIEHISLINIILHDLALIIISILAIQLSNQKLKAEQLKNDADFAKKQLEIFMNTVAHDLMQPITVAKLYADMLDKIKDKNSGGLQKNFVSAINTIKQLASDLRDAGRIRSGQFMLNPEKMDSSELIKDVIAQQQITTSKHKITLNAPKELNVKWDKERIKQVFTNLLTNAIKYSPDGGKIKVKVKKNYTTVIISISDKGIGLSPHQYGHIFQPFVRVYKGKKEIKGTGLGLYISKSIIEGHKGKIWVNGKKGKGSTFFVKLPLA